MTNGPTKIENGYYYTPPPLACIVAACLVATPPGRPRPVLLLIALALPNLIDWPQLASESIVLIFPAADFAQPILPSQLVAAPKKQKQKKTPWRPLPSTHPIIK